MDDTILALLLGVAIFGIILGIVKVIKLVQKREFLKQELAARELELHREATRKWRESAREKTLSVASSNTPPKRQVTATPTYAPSPTQSVNQYQDNFMSDMATAMVINSLLSSTHEAQSGHVTEDRDTGKVEVKVEKSWGFDDSDSRKSASDSFSSKESSSSWFSSSDSSSSSSDSGPSSDW